MRARAQPSVNSSASDNVETSHMVLLLLLLFYGVFYFKVFSNEPFR